jgi:5'-phosphate synthase pdxT subunit
MDIVARRNAYGRQLGSFHTLAPFKGIPDKVPMTFIRAPFIQETGKEVEVMAVVDHHIVAARQGNQLVTAFHPELDEDPRLHQYFVNMVHDFL